MNCLCVVLSSLIANLSVADVGVGCACARAHEPTSARPQPLSLPTSGPCKAYHGDCAEYRPIPGRVPADNPASHPGEVVYAGDRQVNHDQEECVPPIEGHAPPGMGRHAHGAPTDLTRTLLLCTLAMRGALHAARHPRATSCTTSPGARYPSLAGVTAHTGRAPNSAELAILAAILSMCY